MDLPNGRFFEFEDLSEEVREQAIQSFLEVNLKVIRAQMKQRRKEVQEFGLMWMIHSRGRGTYVVRNGEKNYIFPTTWRSIAQSLIAHRKWELNHERCKKVIIGNLTLFTAEGKCVPIFNYED